MYFPNKIDRIIKTMITAPKKSIIVNKIFVTGHFQQSTSPAQQSRPFEVNEGSLIGICGAARSH